MRRATAACLFLAFGVAACGGGGTGSDLSGQIVADGSSTVFPITQAVAEEFRAEAAGVRISVGTSGTGGGFEKFCRGETDMSNASRRIKDEEAALCAKDGVEFVELEVAADGLSVVVNPQNDWAACLTVQDLRSIWEPGSRVRRWNQIRPEFPDRGIALYGPGTDSGTFDYFTAEIAGEEGASRSDYTASEDDNVLVQGVAGDPGSLGYFGFAYYEQNTDKLRALGVDPGTGCVEPSPETINDGTYEPLSRPLYVYVAKAAAARPEVKAFVDFYLEAAPILVGDVGYVPLAAEDQAATRRAWEDFSEPAAAGEEG